MFYQISVAERGLTGIANIFRSRLSGLDDLLRAGTVPLMKLSPRCPLVYTRRRHLDVFADSLEWKEKDLRFRVRMMRKTTVAA